MVPQKGFSLIELLATLVLFAILLSVATGVWKNTYSLWRIENAAVQLAQALQNIRTQALSLHQPITLCPLSNDTCSNNWNDTTIAFIDDNRNAKLDNGETIQLKFPPPDIQTQFVGFSTSRFLRFEKNGATNQNGTFTLTLGTFTQSVIINRPGRVRISK